MVAIGHINEDIDAVQYLFAKLYQVSVCDTYKKNWCYAWTLFDNFRQTHLK